MRPRQRECAGKIGEIEERLSRFSRRCLENTRCCLGNARRCRGNLRWRFERRCRSFLIRRTGEIKHPEASEIESGETTAKLRREIIRQTGQNFLAIFSPLFTTLLKLHNAPTDFPICCRHERIEGASTGATRGGEQFAHAARQTGVVASGDGCRFQLCGGVVVRA